MAEISTDTQRQPVTHYVFFNATGVAVTLTTANTWANITQNLVKEAATKEIGAKLDSAANDESIRSTFTGPYMITAEVTISGGTATNDSFLGIMVDQTGAFPRADTTVAANDRDVSDPDGKRTMRVTKLIENVSPVLDVGGPDGTKIQFALSSDLVNDSPTLHRMDVWIERLDAQRGTGA